MSVERDDETHAQLARVCLSLASDIDCASGGVSGRKVAVAERLNGSVRLSHVSYFKRYGTAVAVPGLHELHHTGGLDVPWRKRAHR